MWHFNLALTAIVALASGTEPSAQRPLIRSSSRVRGGGARHTRTLTRLQPTNFGELQPLDESTAIPELLPPTAVHWRRFADTWIKRGAHVFAAEHADAADYLGGAASVRLAADFFVVNWLKFGAAAPPDAQPGAVSYTVSSLNYDLFNVRLGETYRHRETDDITIFHKLWIAGRTLYYWIYAENRRPAAGQPSHSPGYVQEMKLSEDEKTLQLTIRHGAKVIFAAGYGRYASDTDRPPAPSKKVGRGERIAYALSRAGPAAADGAVAVALGAIVATILVGELAVQLAALPAVVLLNAVNHATGRPRVRPRRLLDHQSSSD